MADSNVQKINDQQTENQKQLKLPQEELNFKREKLQKVSEAMNGQDFFKFAGENLSEDEKKALRENFKTLLDGLDNLGTFDESLLTKTQESLGEIVTKVESLQNEGKLTENKKQVESLKSFQKTFNKIIGETRSLILKIAPFEEIVELNKEASLVEIKNKIEGGKDMFKLPVQSLKGFFTDEVERSLYRENDDKFKPHILGLRKSWTGLQEIYHKNSSYLHDSTDNFDDARFQDLMNDLVSNEAEGKWDSKDMADFLIESQKVIRALKARMEIKGKDEPDSDVKKNTLIKFLKDNQFIQSTDEAFLGALDGEDLIQYVKNLMESQTLEKVDTDIKSVDADIKKKTELEEQITTLESEKSSIENAQNSPNYQTKPNHLKDLERLKKEIPELQSKKSFLDKANLDQKKTALEAKKSALQKMPFVLKNFEKSQGNAGSNIDKKGDIEKLEDIESAINKVIDGVKIDGEKGVREIKGEITKKYAELERKQRKFKRMLLEENVSDENLTKLDEEIRQARDALDEMTAEHLGKGFNETILNQIKLQEKDIYEELVSLAEIDELKLKDKLEAESDMNKKLAMVNKFFKDKRVRRLRDLHDELGHFSDPNREAEYIRFMNQDSPRYQKDADQIGAFHSNVQERIIQGAFGNPLENSGSVKGFWNKIAGAASWLSTMKNQDVSGSMKICKKTIDVLGGLGYNIAKTSVHYPAKWIGKGFGAIANTKTLQWLHKAPESKGLIGFFAKIAKAPVRLFSAPIYYSLKGAEFALTQTADIVGGEITEGGKFSPGVIDKFLGAMTDGQVDNLWKGLFEGMTQSIGLACEKTHKFSKLEKKKTLAKFLQGEDMKSATEKIRKMGDAVYARNVVKGVY